MQSIRKGLLGAFNLQVEPQLPAGGLERVREQWRSTFSNIAHRAMDAAGKWNTKFREITVDVTLFQPEPNPHLAVILVPAVSGYSVSPDGGNSTSLKCCSMVSEIFMKGMQQCLFMFRVY